MKRTKLGAVIVLSLAATLTGVNAGAQETIKLGLTAALTGPFNEFGEGIRRGALVALAEWNTKGGVNGKKAELAIALDDQLSPERAAQNMRRILDDSSIVAILSPSGSGPTIAVLDMVVADGRPMCNTMAQTPSIVYPDGDEKPPRPTIFSRALHNTAEEEGLLKLIERDGFKKIGLIHESTSYGKSGLDLFQDLIKKNKSNLQVVPQSYNQRAQDMSAQIARFMRENVQAILIIGLGADAAVVRNTMARLGLNVPFYASGGATTVPYFEGAGELAIGTRGLQFKDIGKYPLTGAVAQFAKSYRAMYPDPKDRWYGSDPERPKISIASTVGSGYDCVNILLDAIRRAGSTDRNAIIKALNETKNLPGVGPTMITFTPSKHNAVTINDLGEYRVERVNGELALKLQQ